MFKLIVLASFFALQIDAKRNDYVRADFFNLDAISKQVKVPKNVRIRVEADEKLNQAIAKGFSSKDYSSGRPGNSVETHACDTITSVPSHLTFITRHRFYAKYTHAYGIPVVASSRVSDAALKKACYICRFLFADRWDVRQMMYKKYGRLAVIAINEQTTTIPEFSHLPDWWNTRARGLGGMLSNPISCGGEENLLCMSSDRYYGDDIFFHESAHSVAEVALMGGAIPGMYQAIGRQFRSARHLWRNTYSATDQREYFAEALQSFTNCHTSKLQPGVHNHINTRAELRNYDPGMYRLLKKVYPCMNTYHWCKSGPPPAIRMNCDKTNPSTQAPQTDGPVNTDGPVKTDAPTGCTDSHSNCQRWASQGECNKNPSWMKVNCKKSCNTCGGTGNGCSDKMQYCPDWARAGYCNQQSVKDNCKKSCDLC